MKGSRVQAVVQELRGEAIDIIPYHPDPARFIVHAIAPAQVARVYMDEHTHSMELVVPDDQLSKAIGRRGQNVRLAAQLTGWRIDIFSETRHSEMTEQARVELSRIEELDQETVEILIRHGFRSAQELADAEAYEVGQILGIEESDGEKIVNRAEAVLDQLIMEEAERRKQKKEAPPPAEEADLAPDADEPNGHDDDSLVPETGASEATQKAADPEEIEDAADEGAPGRPPEA